MAKYIINGPASLSGEIKVAGAKNMALKALAASLMSSEPLLIKNVPEIEDVKRLLEILKKLGVEVNSVDANQYRLLASQINPDRLDGELVGRLRASLVLLGPLLARFGQASFPHPGGCIIGKRPIDLFINGFKALGAQVKEVNGSYEFKAKRLQGATIVFPQITVSGTETLMLAAVLAKGKTELINAAEEPEIVALANYLNANGARISGIGSSKLIIEGVDEIGAGEITVIPDRIETGSFLAMALVTSSRINITSCQPKHLQVPLAILKGMGAEMEVGENNILIKKSKGLKCTNIKTHEYPGFVTDMQAPFTVLMTQVEGQSLMHETIYEGRLFYTDYLNRMGANIILCDPHRAIITGPTPLRGKELESPDIRAGIAMVIAGLAATGRTTIDNIYQIERGYENLIVKLQRLGASIERVD